MSEIVKAIGLLFSAPMIRAVLAGTKSQTRRGVKGAPDGPDSYVLGVHQGVWGINADVDRDDGTWRGRCPYGEPGDLLWVRETFFAFGRWETRFNAKKARDEWHFVDMTLETGRAYHYAATAAPKDYTKRTRARTTPAWWKRPAIHMPRAASRITLRVTDVRIERLHAITEADARAEGIVPFSDRHGWHTEDGRHYAGDPVDSYLGLWAEINGVESARANGWVWVVSFERA